MTDKARIILTKMRDQFRENHNDERADALTEILEETESCMNPPTGGKWQKIDRFFYRCSECGYKVGLDVVKNYCPYCGAYMKENYEQEFYR